MLLLKARLALELPPINKALSRAAEGGNAHAMSWRISPARESRFRLRRLATVSAERHTVSGR